MAHLVEYWENVKLAPERDSLRDRLSGLMFSVLATIDGVSADIPKFILAPDPHQDDKDYHIFNKVHYYPENYQNVVNGDISGCLREMINSFINKKKTIIFTE